VDPLDANSFDFWLGDWNCAFDGGRGVNRVTRELGGNVIVERFELVEPRPWQGRSLSVYDPHAGWRQTWVDETPNYWHFEGALVDGDPCFATLGRVDQDDRFKRMVFSAITPYGFDWRWESSEDGRDWTLTWALRYTRT
jgi:hypothetical protein